VDGQRAAPSLPLGERGKMHQQFKPLRGRKAPPALELDHSSVSPARPLTLPSPPVGERVVVVVLLTLKSYPPKTAENRGDLQCALWAWHSERLP